MGLLEENSISELTLRPIGPDGSYGEEIKMENFDGVTHFLDLDDNIDVELSVASKLLFEPITLMLTGTLTLPHQKKSRKTFKKWLMSRGFNRNLAERFCNIVKSYHGEKSYQSLYFNGLFLSTPQDLVNILFDTLFPIYTIKETET